jgi:hypothetical protein
MLLATGIEIFQQPTMLASNLLRRQHGNARLVMLPGQGGKRDKQTHWQPLAHALIPLVLPR